MTISGNHLMEEAEQYTLHTYHRFPFVLEKGEGVYLYDTDGKKYLDFAAGIAVFALGYGNPTFEAALKDQISKLIHTSNLYYNVPMAEAAKKLAQASGLDKVFFTNSGTEAIEGALKAARKYAWQKGRKECNQIIAMEHSFHGRSLGALSVTGNAAYQEAFKPLVGGVKFATFNNIESVRAQLSDRTCAIILEPVQGEGGIYPAEPAYLKEIRELCDQRDIVLIFDEIQCGMGRTGYPFAWQEYGVKPDIMTCAKALGCGIPVGAFVLNEKLGTQSLAPGDHGSTYGGNPLATRAVSTVFDLYEELHLIEHVRALTPYLEEKLDTLVNKYQMILGRRGKGFMQGLILAPELPVVKVVQSGHKHGILVISAGGNVLRLVPPLVIEKEHIDEMLLRLEKALLECI